MAALCLINHHGKTITYRAVSNESKKTKRHDPEGNRCRL